MQIILADDHKLMRDGLRPFLLELSPEVEIFDAATVDEAIEAVGRAERLALVLLDLKMPGMDGLDGLARIKALRPQVPVVVVSGYSTRDHVMAAVQNGAAGFIPKTVSGTAMVNALRLVLSGERYLPSGTFFGDTEPPPPFDKLSRREGEILGLLLKGGTNKEIALVLDLQEVTIKVHLRSVFRKIAVSNRTQAVRATLSSGWHPPIPG